MRIATYAAAALLSLTLLLGLAGCKSNVAENDGGSTSTTQSTTTTSTTSTTERTTGQTTNNTADDNSGLMEELGEGMTGNGDNATTSR